MEYEVRLTTVGKSETVGQITVSRQATGEPAAELTLFQSLLIREKFEWVLQKGTEIGVAQIVPVLTSRGLVRTKEIEENKLDRWQPDRDRGGRAVAPGPDPEDRAGHPVCRRRSRDSWVSTAS